MRALEARRAFRTHLCAAALALLCAACATPNVSKVESSALPRPGAKVVVGEVANASGQQPVADIDVRLKEAVIAALKTEGMLAADPPAASDLALTLRITRYEQGNAFKRWLLPGWGSTVLGIAGELKDSQSGKTLASIDYTSTVAVGGLYTVGAWSTIFARSATDVAKDLRARIESGGDFVLAPASRADRTSTAIPPQPDGIVVSVGPVQDLRPEQGRIGERFAAFGVKMSDVYSTRVVPEYFREALIDEIQLHGRRVGEAQSDVAITPSLSKLWVGTNTTPLYWDITAEIECELVFQERTAGAQPLSKHYSGKATGRTFVYPSATLMSRILNEGLDNLFSQIVADPVWASLRPLPKP